MVAFPYKTKCLSNALYDLISEQQQKLDSLQCMVTIESSHRDHRTIHVEYPQCFPEAKSHLGTGCFSLQSLEGTVCCSPVSLQESQAKLLLAPL